MKKNLIIGIIVLITLVGGVVLWNQKSNQRNTKQQTKKEVVGQTQEQKIVQKKETTKEQTTDQNQTIDSELKPEEKIDTSDWKTYRNKEYGFEFKYPRNWEVIKLKNVTTPLYDGLLLNVVPIKRPVNNKLIFDINKFNTTLSPKEWYINNIDNPDNNPAEFDEIIKVNNFETYHVSSNKNDASGSYVIKISPNLILLLGFQSSSDDYDFTEYIPYFKTMVWSLKSIQGQGNEITLGAEDKNKLFNVFLSYLKTNKKDLFDIFNNKELQLTYYQLKEKNGVKYLIAIISFQGQHSTPNFLAVNKNNGWQIIFMGQDYASCDILKKYDFPKDMNGSEKCFKWKNNKIIDLIDR